MPSLSRLELCNLALAELKAHSITSLDEGSLEARECGRQYPQVVSELLEGPHQWSYALVRASLPSIANPRPGEWAYAYALPVNYAAATRLVPDLAALGLSIPVPLPGEPYAETWAFGQDVINMPYIIEGSILYTNTSPAILEYVVNDVSELPVSSRLARAITLELAGRLAVPVKGNAELKKELLAQAERAWQHAIADDRNRQPTYSGNYVSEVMLARQGC